MERPIPNARDADVAAEADPLTETLSGPFGIGVVGHLTDGLLASDRLQAMIASVMAEMHEAAPPHSTFRLISSLAGIADGLIGDAALRLGWALDAILPYCRAEYTADLADRSPIEVHLGWARSVFELPGEHGSAECYERASRVMLTQCDILFAVWDGGVLPGRDRVTQIIGEAMAQSVPVICVDPSGRSAPSLLWSGLNDHDFGLETIGTVARGGLADLPRLFASLVAEPPPRAERPSPLADFIRPVFASAYPMLLAITGVRRQRARHVPVDVADDDLSEQSSAFAQRVRALLEPSFTRANVEAGRIAVLFRSAYVTNFSLAALAVLLSLLGLALPPVAKPVLVAAEFFAIATILIVTRVGARSRWHSRWLENRRYAERLRCLGLSARLGDLALRLGGAPREVARRLGMPSAVVDEPFLRAARRALLDLLDDQLAYLRGDADRMHRLEHRLHRTGGVLFAVTATLCLVFLMIESIGFVMHARGGPSQGVLIAGTIVSAAFPAIGAAIYGIRMQGDFAGIAERNVALVEQLRHLRDLGADDAVDFDMLRRLARRATDLMTLDVTQWLQAYQARPLALPG